MGNRVATTDKIQGNVGPLLCCFFNNNYSSVDVYLFLLSHLHEHEIHFGIIFGGFNPNLLTVFQI